MDVLENCMAKWENTSIFKGTQDINNNIKKKQTHKKRNYYFLYLLVLKTNLI